HGGPRRSRRGLRPVWALADCLQLLPQPALPEVPRGGPRTLARRPRRRIAPRRGFPRGLHAPPRPRAHRFAQSPRGLRHALPRDGGDPAAGRRGPETSWREDWLPSRVAHLGPEPALASPSTLRRSRRRDRGRWDALGRLPARLFLAGARP